MNSGYLKYQKAHFHYSVYGNGPKVLIAFHGYGQSGEHFKEIAEALKNEYTVYSFDLFYHGESFWHERDKPLTKDFFRELMQMFFNQKKLTKFSVMGFSMGGKFALTTLELFNDKIDNIILIAPDGVKTSFWYSLATYPGWLTTIFKNIIVKPQLYFGLVKFLFFFRLVDRGILRFANTQMNTRKQRRRVYYSWVVFRELKFDNKKIAKIINNKGIVLQMFVGEFDKIITKENMKVLLKKLNHYQFHILPVGHNGLLSAVAEHYNEKSKG